LAHQRGNIMGCDIISHHGGVYPFYIFILSSKYINIVTKKSIQGGDSLTRERTTKVPTCMLMVSSTCTALTYSKQGGHFPHNKNGKSSQRNVE
jgi:hypothetical protein